MPRTVSRRILRRILRTVALCRPPGGHLGQRGARRCWRGVGMPRAGRIRPTLKPAVQPQQRRRAQRGFWGVVFVMFCHFPAVQVAPTSARSARRAPSRETFRDDTRQSRHANSDTPIPTQGHPLQTRIYATASTEMGRRAGNFAAPAAACPRAVPAGASITASITARITTRITDPPQPAEKRRLQRVAVTRHLRAPFGPGPRWAKERGQSHSRSRLACAAQPF